jgi:hypothetical protein
MTNQDLGPAILPHNTLVEFQEPVGWCIIPLKAAPDILEDGGGRGNSNSHNHNNNSNDDDDDDNDNDNDSSDDEEQGANDDDNNNYKNKPPKRCVKAHLIQIQILSQHQNGRDTHVRQVQLYGPRTNNADAMRKIQKQEMKRSTQNSHPSMTTTTTTTTVDGGDNHDSNNKQDSNNNNNNNNMAAQSSRLWLQRGRHWDEDFTTVAMSQFSTVR